jgi:hypothetical protein
MPTETTSAKGLTDRELLEEVATVVGYLNGQLERLDNALQARMAERIAEEAPRLRLIPEADDA